MKNLILLLTLTLSATLAQAKTLTCFVNDEGEIMDPIEVNVVHSPVEIYKKTTPDDMTFAYSVGLEMSLDFDAGAEVQRVTIIGVNAKTGKITSVGVDYDAGIEIKCRLKKK